MFQQDSNASSIEGKGPGALDRDIARDRVAFHNPFELDIHPQRRGHWCLERESVTFDLTIDDLHARPLRRACRRAGNLPVTRVYHDVRSRSAAGW